MALFFALALTADLNDKEKGDLFVSSEWKAARKPKQTKDKEAKDAENQPTELASHGSHLSEFGDQVSDVSPS